MYTAPHIKYPHTPFKHLPVGTQRELLLHREILKKLQRTLKHHWMTRLVSALNMNNLNHTHNLNHDYNSATIDICSKTISTWGTESGNPPGDPYYLGCISIFANVLQITTALERYNMCLKTIEVPLEDPNCFDKIIEAAHHFWNPQKLETYI